MDKITAQMVATVGSYATVTHALRGALHYDRPMFTRCGLLATGYESMWSGSPIEITCGNCVRILTPNKPTRNRWIMYSFVGMPGEFIGRLSCHESLEWAQRSLWRFSRDTYSYEQAHATLYPFTPEDWQAAREFETTGCPLDSLAKIIEFGPREGMVVRNA